MAYVKPDDKTVAELLAEILDELKKLNATTNEMNDNQAKRN